ncbi:hypothetical protein AB1N83_012721 [Pleurotus pulmonarius]
MSSASQTPVSSPTRSTSRTPLSSASNHGRSSPDERHDRASLDNRRRSPSWNLTQTFRSENGEDLLEGVLRSWSEAKNSCKLILEYDDARDEEEEDAYMRFLEEREAIAREMLAKVACAKLKWGAEVDGRTLEVLEAYLAENKEEFSDRDLEIATASVASRKQKERGGARTGGPANGRVGGAGGGDEPDARAGNEQDGRNEPGGDGGNEPGGDGGNEPGGDGGNEPGEDGGNEPGGDGGNEPGGDGGNEPGGDGGNEPGGDGGNEAGGGGVGGNNGERPPKKPRKAKLPIIAQLSDELSRKIDDVNMAGYEAVEDRFRCVYAHVGAVHGKLTERDLWDAVNGYCHESKHKGFLEEEALARLIVGYGEINMERLNETFGNVKTAYSCGPREARGRLVKICDIQSDKERVDASEKGSVSLLEGIFLTMAGLRLAIDRKNVPDTDDGRRWKKRQSDDLFELRYGAALANVPVLERKGREHTWRKRWMKAHEKMVTRRNKVLALFKEFGCIVLLDPLWSPLETSSPDFHQLHACILDNVLTRRQRADDDVEGNGDVPWHTGNEVGNRRMLLEVVRYFTTDAMANFIDDTVNKLEEEASQIVV